jgi:lipopolysaccharide export system permease protein
MDERIFLIPIFWKYLLKGYCKTLSLCIGGFISLLLVMRLKEIARFAALASSALSVVQFVLTQIPFIMPMCIPISCLIASVLLFQRMSRNQEMTALRSSGLSLKSIAFPILLFSLFISFLDLYIASEMAPLCRIKSRSIMKKQSSTNPIFLLERQNLLKIHHSFVDIEEKQNDLLAKDILFITYNNFHDRLNLFHFGELSVDEDLLIGKNVAIISHVPAIDFDTLVIENQQLMTTKAEVFSKLMVSQQWNLNANQLTLPMLLIKSEEKNSSTHERLDSMTAEIVRRLAMALSCFSLTFIGIAFGVEIGRLHSKKGIFLASFLSLLVLSSFFIGKEFRFYPLLAILVYIAPQPIILLVAIRTLKKVSRGQE